MRRNQRGLGQNGRQSAFDPQGALQVDRASGFELSEVGPLQAFLEEIEHALVIPLRGDREAAAVDCHAFPDSRAAGRAGTFDQQLDSLTAPAQPDHFADLPNQSGEHGVESADFSPVWKAQRRKMRQRSQRFGLAGLACLASL